MTKIKTGPLLGIENENKYTFCFLSDKKIKSAVVYVDGLEIEANKIDDLPDGAFWRAEGNIKVDDGIGRDVYYQIHFDGEAASDLHGRDGWGFYVPAYNENPKLAYASCNGVSKADLVNKVSEPFRLWREMAEQHRENRFSLLVMGGDQVYADSIWDKVPELSEWALLNADEQKKRQASTRMTSQIDRFYSKLYAQRWADVNMSYIFSSVPSIMMWDDHDIFDGWGSFPDEMQNCSVYKEIFWYAKKYFELFQVRSKNNSALLSPTMAHYSFGLSFRGYNILALDNRSQRTIRQVMGEIQWGEVINYLEGVVENSVDNVLIVMSAVPVVYRDFSFTEYVYDATPWGERLTDDLMDHWRAKEHQGERLRLIMRLLDNARARTEKSNDEKIQTLILSGDVHVGCMGVITDRRVGKRLKIHQVVSSGVVHPSPSFIEWQGISAVTNDDLEFLNEDGTIDAAIIKPVGSNKYIRARNFVTLQKEGDKRVGDGKLWINWITEADDNPVYALD